MIASKVLRLVVANLKSFARDWKSVVLLIVLPLVIIGLIFASFSSGIQQLSIGVVDKTEGFDMKKFNQEASYFADLQDYENIRECTSDITSYKVYACSLVEKSSNSQSFKIRLFYDNTRNFVGTRIAQNMKNVASSMQLEYSQQRASTIIAEVRSLNKQIEGLLAQVKKAKSDLDSQIADMNAKIEELRQTRNGLREDTQDMDEDVEEEEESLKEIDSAREDYYTKTSTRIDRMQRIIGELDNLSSYNSERVERVEQDMNEAERELEETNHKLESEINDRQQLIENYKEFSEDSKEYRKRINQTIDDLKQTRRDLKDYKIQLNRLESDLKDMNSRYSQIADQRAPDAASFVSVENRKTYTPGGAENGNLTSAQANLLLVQTIYSTLLLLVSFFVALLVSMFITLRQMNSRAKNRLNVIPKMFFAEYLASYISSFIIIMLPVLCVLVLGDLLFRLPITENGAKVAIILFLVGSSTINLGMSISYLIKKKSVTLLVGSLMFVFLVFFSGFILPLEMMNSVASQISSNLPGSLGLRSFNVAVLYEKPVSAISYKLRILALWAFLLSLLALGIKKYRALKKASIN